MAENASFLLGLVLIFDAILRNRQSEISWKAPVVYGLMTGGIGVWIMLTPWQYRPGINFDACSVLLSMSGLFFGTVPTLIAVLMTVSLRIYQGGSGVLVGVCVIIATASLGLLWRRLSWHTLLKTSWQELYLFGVLTHLVVLGLIFVLPRQTALSVLERIGLPVMIIFPLVSLALGLLMIGRLRRRQAYLKMRESEKKYRQIVEVAREGIWSIDQHGLTTFVNQEMAQMLGYSAGEMEHKPMVNYIFKIDQADHAFKMDERRLGRQGRYQRRFRRRDGSECWVLVSASPIQDEDGQFSGSLGMVSDISSLKQARELLKESETQYRILTESIKDVVWILDAQSLCFRYISPSVERLRGYTPEEVISEPLEAALVPEVYPIILALINARKAAFLSGQAAPDLFYTDEVEQPTRAGKRVWTEVITNYYLNAESGRVEVRGVSRDISERKQAEAVLQLSQLELQRLLLETEASRRQLVRLVEEQDRTEVALQKSSEELRDAYDVTLQGWSNALEMREHETAGHSRRVVSLTLELARAFEIPEDLVVHIQRGALLHDIGKMGIPDSILLKPDGLTEQEWNIMRQHPELAYRLLSNIAYLAPALEIPYCHHERWDGTGYPRGLCGLEIPLSARIFSVVDVWDALSFNRPYRQAWPKGDVSQYIKENAGRQFDPQVVAAFNRLVEMGELVV